MLSEPSTPPLDAMDALADQKKYQYLSPRVAHGREPQIPVERCRRLMLADMSRLVRKKHPSENCSLLEAPEQGPEREDKPTHLP